MKQIKKFKKAFLDEVVRSRTDKDINEILDLYSMSDSEFCAMYFNRVLPIYISMMKTFLEQKKIENFSEFSWEISVKTKPSGMSLSFSEDSITITYSVSENEKLRTKLENFEKEFGIDLFLRIPVCSIQEERNQAFEDEVVFLVLCGIITGVLERIDSVEAMEYMSDGNWTHSITERFREEYDELMTVLHIITCDRNKNDRYYNLNLFKLLKRIQTVPSKTKAFMSHLDNSYINCAGAGKNDCELYSFVDIDGNVIYHPYVEPDFNGNTMLDYKTIEFDLIDDKFTLEYGWILELE